MDECSKFIKNSIFFLFFGLSFKQLIQGHSQTIGLMFSQAPVLYLCGKSFIQTLPTTENQLRPIVCVVSMGVMAGWVISDPRGTAQYT